MIYILIIMLVVLSIITLLSFKDLFSPSFMSYSVFLFSLIILVPNIKSWNFTMNGNTLFIILFSLLIMGIGELLARTQSDLDTKNSFQTKKVNFNNFYFSTKFTYFISLSISVYIIVYFLAIRNVASMFGNVTTFNNIMQYYNIANSEGYAVAESFTIINIVISTVCYFYIYNVIYTIVYEKTNKQYKLNLIPIMLYFIILSISASRSSMLYMLIYIVVIAYNLTRAKYISKIYSNKKIIKLFLSVIFIFFTLFYILGNFTGKSQSFNSASEGISLYTSSSIVALDSYMVDYNYSIGDFGAETLMGFRRIVSRLSSSNVVETRHLEFVPVTPLLRTNIYTSFRRYLNDFNYLGLFFIQFFIGYFFTRTSIKIFRPYLKNREIKLIIYAYLYQAVIMQVIDEKFLTVIFTPSFLIQYLLFYMFYWLFRNNNKRKIKFI